MGAPTTAPCEPSRLAAEFGSYPRSPWPGPIPMAIPERRPYPRLGVLARCHAVVFPHPWSDPRSPPETDPALFEGRDERPYHSLAEQGGVVLKISQWKAPAQRRVARLVLPHWAASRLTTQGPYTPEWALACGLVPARPREKGETRPGRGYSTPGLWEPHGMRGTVTMLAV